MALNLAARSGNVDLSDMVSFCYPEYYILFLFVSHGFAFVLPGMEESKFLFRRSSC